MSKVSMLVVVTPDGRSHGQRLSEEEAVALVRRLMELRGQAAPDGAAPRQDPAPRRHRPGGGRPKVWLVGDELERARALVAEGMSTGAVARAMHRSREVVERSLAGPRGDGR